MKSKPLAIAIVILAAAIILAVYTKKKPDADNTPSDTHGQTTQTANGKISPRESRSTGRQKSSSLPKEWENQIDTLLSDDATSNKQAALGLLAIVLNESAPLAARLDALEHALNLIGDDDFNMIGNIIGTGKNELPAPLAQAIIDDTYNRPDTIQVTTALKFIQGKHSEIIEEAIELLEFQTDEEHGNDINAWKKAVADFIEQQDATQDEDTQDEDTQDEDTQDEDTQDEDTPDELPDGDVPGEQ